MQLADRLVLDAPRRTSDGYLAVRAKAARVGTYDYLAAEVGAPDTFKPTDVVKVYRDANEVFAQLHRPTDHQRPPQHRRHGGELERPRARHDHGRDA